MCGGRGENLRREPLFIRYDHYRQPRHKTWVMNTVEHISLKDLRLKLTIST